MKNSTGSVPRISHGATITVAWEPAFTLLPCLGAPTQRTTLAQDGRVEHQVVKRDRQIDALNGTFFTKLGDDAARRRFIADLRDFLHDLDPS